MREIEPGRRKSLLCSLAMLCAASVGCATTAKPGTPLWAPNKTVLDQTIVPAPDAIPRELSKTSMPEYVIEIPDILLLDAVNIVPRAPYRVSLLDALNVNVLNTLPDHPIQGVFYVQAGGTIDLGPPYGTVTINGLTIEEATSVLEQHLRQYLSEPEVFVSLAQSAGMQQIVGEHLVGPDGRVTLGTYGKVFVNGMTQAEAKEAIEKYLTQFLENPQISVDIFAYNSKKYYLISQGAGLGDGVFVFPHTGNETVLDAISQVGGLESVSSLRIWIARPAPHGNGCDQILPIDWHAITQRANTSTNYQIFPNDRVYIAEDPFIKADTVISKVTAPFERIAGTLLLGVGVVQRFRFFNRFGTGVGGGFGGGGGVVP